MPLIEKAKDLIGDVRAYWKAPAAGEYVAYKEYLMLSIGWLGMRLATCFGIGFSVNDHFTAMTLHMTHRDLILLGYVCTAVSYALAPLNAFIIDNLRSRAGKYKVFIRLALPSAALSLFALYYPYEKLSYMPMVVSLFIIGQIQGYVQGWYNTGVSNLAYVISPNSNERVKIFTVTSLIHNFAPSLTGFLIPTLSDVFAGGDLYNVKTFRTVYPLFIVIGAFMSMAAYFGVSERIIAPRSRATGVGLIDALRDVARNKYFWIKCSDNWNNFMEDCKNVLMQWLFYYGKVGSMTLYGVMDTLSYNSSMWAMLFSPWMIKKLGKRGFKLAKNVSQVFITLGLALTYKKSLALIFIFYFLNRFWETTEVIDRAIESDIRDYQQYISGERIDGSFGVIDTYVGGAVGAVTNLFVPWVYKKNGFDGTDYNVLKVYDDDGNYRPGNVLYKLLDNLLTFSLIGAAIDVLPWIFYDLTETDQASVVRVIRIRSAVEDRNAGVAEDRLYCEACEAVLYMREHLSAPALSDETAAATKKEKRAIKAQNKAKTNAHETALFIQKELCRYTTPFGSAFAALCNGAANMKAEAFFESYDSLLSSVRALPAPQSKDEKDLFAEAQRRFRSVRRAKQTVRKKYPNGFKAFSAADYEALYDLPEDTPEQRKEKRAAIREGNRERRLYGRVMKPYLWACRHAALALAYQDINGFISDYPETKARLDEREKAERIAAEIAAAERREQAKNRLRRK